jgi:arylsulfatase A-like enzyme
MNREWKDDAGNVLKTTAPQTSKAYYEVVGATPFANDYELEFARQLVMEEHLGKGQATDLLSVSLSANDILGHQVGPDSPQMKAMALALDRQLADFFAFLGQQVGLANVWIALSADHGVSPLPAVASKLHIPADGLDGRKLRDQLNDLLTAQLSPGHNTEYVKALDYPTAWLDDTAFAPVRMKEAEAEHAVGEALKEIGLRGYYTRAQLAQGAASDTEVGRQFLHSYAPTGGWYVLGIPPPYTVGSLTGTDHASPYSYDTHVPLAFYGLAFQAGIYRGHSEPVDLAVTLASLLGINAPSSATGRVLTEALAGNEKSSPKARLVDKPGAQ